MAVQVRVSIKNQDKLIAAFKRFPQEMAGTLREAIMASSFEVEREAKIFSPVDTGRMRASIATSLGIKNQGLSSIVQTNVNYAITVHEGLGIGRNSRPRRFMEQGANAARPKIEAHFKKATEKALDLLK